MSEIKWKWPAVVVVAVGLIFGLTTSAFAYIDPGTAGAAFSSLAPLIAVLGTVLLFAIWPFRMLYRWARALRWYFQVLVYLAALAVLGACVAIIPMLFAG